MLEVLLEVLLDVEEVLVLEDVLEDVLLVEVELELVDDVEVVVPEVVSNILNSPKIQKTLPLYL